MPLTGWGGRGVAADALLLASRDPQATGTEGCSYTQESGAGHVLGLLEPWHLPDCVSSRHQ